MTQAVVSHIFFPFETASVFCTACRLYPCRMRFRPQDSYRTCCQDILCEILLGIGFKRGESIINAFYGRVAKAVIICYRCGIVYRQAATVIDSVKLVRYGHIQLYGFFGGFFGQCGRFILRRYRRAALLL